MREREEKVNVREREEEVIVREGGGDCERGRRR